MTKLKEQYTYKTAVELMRLGIKMVRASKNLGMRYIYMEGGHARVEPSGLLYVPTKADKKAKDWEIVEENDEKSV